MRKLSLISIGLALVGSLLASAAHAAVETKVTYRGQDAYAYITVTSEDGCQVTNISVGVHDIEQRLGGDHVPDRFTVLGVDAGDYCTGNVLLVGYADNINQDVFNSVVFDPQHDSVRLQARLIMQDFGSDTYYWASIDLTWSIVGPTVVFDDKDYIDFEDGSILRYRGKGESRASVARGSLSIEPYFTDPLLTVPYIGSGISFGALDSSTTPEHAESNFYSELKYGDRIIYRR
jgi:hypothetical protein